LRAAAEAVLVQKQAQAVVVAFLLEHLYLSHLEQQLQ
jgi:hypothetical protein